MTMRKRFLDQARACADLGSPMYAELLERVVEDLDAGGPAREVLAGHEDDPGPSALALRLLGSVHRVVLTGRAPALAACYPSVGGTWDPDAGWDAFAALLRERPDEVRAFLDRPPQTNEVGRAGALVGGLLRIGETFRHPVRLFEIGSSGGLNLRADRFRYLGEGMSYGPEDSPVRLEDAWRGRPVTPWDDLRIVERVGSDVDPVDLTTEDGRTTLLSYVWPDQTARLRRLRAAVALAERFPVTVRRQDAVSFVRDLRLAPGTTTVLWHSVTWQYLPRADQAAVTEAVERLGAAADEAGPFAHLSLEPTRRAPDSAHEFLVVLQLWPTGERRVIGASVGHGLPTTWE